MNRIRAGLGYTAAAILIASTVAHSFFGWPSLAGQLATAQAPPDLIDGLRIGWQFGGASMLTFGLIIIWAIANRDRIGSRVIWPVMLIGICYVGFGLWAIITTGNLFFAIFVVPGLLMLIAAAPGRDPAVTEGGNVR